MSQIDGEDDPTPPDVTIGATRASRYRPAALAAAAQADEIAIDRKWAPARTLILVLAAPAVFWALIALLMAHR